jgi:uncharacterized protein (TIGR02284 family)
MSNIDNLKSLTQSTYDSVEGYRKAAEAADSPELKRALRNRADQRTQSLNVLNDQLASAGEEPVSTVSTSGSGHQLWMQISNAFRDGDANAASRVEEGEDRLLDEYREALDDDEFDPSTRRVIENVYAEIKSGERFGDMLKKQYA